MPYVLEERAEELRSGVPPETQGELTYLICWNMMRYLDQQTMKDYATLSSAKAAATDSVDEFQYRMMRPYEDRKRHQTRSWADDALANADPFRRA